MTDTRNPTWDDVRRIAEELELKMHLAGMDMRDRWNELQPRLAEIQKVIAREGERAGKLVVTQISSLGKALQELRNELESKHGEKPASK